MERLSEEKFQIVIFIFFNQTLDLLEKVTESYLFKNQVSSCQQSSWRTFIVTDISINNV